MGCYRRHSDCSRGRIVILLLIILLFYVIPVTRSPTLERRFWAKVEKTDTCWLWTAALDRSGYGVISSGKVNGSSGRALQAHRVAWELVIGDIPDGEYVRHSCSNQHCVRPDHLYLSSTPRLSIEDRLWSKVNKTETCWLWEGAKSGDDCGVIRIDGKTRSVRRISWELSNGPIEGRQYVHTTCGNRSCIRPDYLILSSSTRGSGSSKLASYLDDEFWEGISWNGDDSGCWKWDPLLVCRYADLTPHQARQKAWEIVHGEEVEVTYSCSEPKCVRPEHLIVRGTSSCERENVLERAIRVVRS